MTAVSERVIVEKIHKHLIRVGAKAIKVHGSPFMEKGTPDIVGCYQGFCVVIEVKNEEGRLSPIQRRRLQEWRAAGARAGAVRSLEGAKRVLHNQTTRACPRCRHTVHVLDRPASTAGRAVVECLRCGLTMEVLEESLYE